MSYFSPIIQALMTMLWLGTTQTSAPNLSGLYTSQSEIVIGLNETTGSSVLVDLKLNLTDTQGQLTGYLTVQAQNSIFPLTLTATGHYQAQAIHLKLMVGFCLESPSIKVNLVLAPDGAIEFSQTTEIITCNFSQIRLVLPHRVRLISRSK